MQGRAHLGREIRHRAAHFSQRRLASAEACGQTKVGDLDIAAGGQEQILGLEIAVHDAKGVDECERERDLPHDRCGLHLAVRALFADPLEDFSAIGQLHDECGGAVGGQLEVVDERDDVAVQAEKRQDAALVLHLRRVSLVHLYELHGILHLRRLVRDEAHGGKGALAEKVAQLVLLQLFLAVRRGTGLLVASALHGCGLLVRRRID